MNNIQSGPGSGNIGPTRIEMGVQLAPRVHQVADIEDLQLLEGSIIKQLMQSESILLAKIEAIQSTLDNVWYKRLYRWLASRFD